MLDFAGSEKELLASKDICHLSTMSVNGWPHTVPVSYILIEGAFFIPSDPESKKVKNIQRNPKSSITIDDERFERGITLETEASILAEGEATALRDQMKILKGWTNAVSTIIIKLDPLRKASWSL
jgi:nitroimidazol reductase NimA-like FMN-containing flavoprotein (pyridoxamine 5'-phosphate oxidase superfamily)